MLPQVQYLRASARNPLQPRICHEKTCSVGAKRKGRGPKTTPPLTLVICLDGKDYIEASEASAAASEAAPEASAAAAEASAAASVASTAASVASSAGFSEQPARAKAVPATAARMSLRMRYNPWIEVNSAGQAARRKAYSAGRLRDPINRQFIALQAQDVCILSVPALREGGLAFFSPDFGGFRACKMLQQSCHSNPILADDAGPTPCYDP